MSELCFEHYPSESISKESDFSTVRILPSFFLGIDFVVSFIDYRCSIFM